MRFKKYSENDLLQAILDSKSYSEVCKKINITNFSKNREKIKKYITENNIDISHFDPYSRNISKGHFINKDINYYLVKNGPHITSSALRKKLIKKNILENKCYICGLNSWQGKDLTLHLDHINGDHYDNSLENLRILCPNCHSQCETSIRQKTKHYCNCGNEKRKKSKTCQQCCVQNLINSNPKSIRPEKSTLEILIQTKTFACIGRMYGVSDTSVQNWCKYYDLPHKKSDIQQLYAKSN